MRTRHGSARDARTRAVFDHRGMAIAARVAVVILAFAITIRVLSGESTQPFGFDAVAAVLGALLVAACGALALTLGRQRGLRAELDRLEHRLEELNDHNWELKEAAERGRSFLEGSRPARVAAGSRGARSRSAKRTPAKRTPAKRTPAKRTRAKRTPAKPTSARQMAAKQTRAAPRC
jgi:hypothetical protein